MPDSVAVVVVLRIAAGGDVIEHGGAGAQVERARVFANERRMTNERFEVGSVYRPGIYGLKASVEWRSALGAATFEAIAELAQRPDRQRQAVGAVVLAGAARVAVPGARAPARIGTR